MKFCIVGCGLIGKKRAKNLSKKHEVTWAVDYDLDLCKQLSLEFDNCNISQDWKTAISSDLVDAVIIAVPHNLLSKISIYALKNNKHVFVEKPGGRNLIDLKNIFKIAKENKLVVQVGYNHRFHPSFIEAKKIIDKGQIGPLMYIKGSYGHGGRKNYDKEWRFNKKISGGGELLDQGSHLIDLSQMFLGSFTKVSGSLPTYFWKGNVEDNAFLLLENKIGNVAWLHTSWTEWKNKFIFEIFGQKGKIQIEGLGGSYGVEKLTLYKMKKELGPPNTTAREYPFEDQSWKEEINHFVRLIETNVTDNISLLDSIGVMNIIQKMYKLSER